MKIGNNNYYQANNKYNKDNAKVQKQTFGDAFAPVVCFASFIENNGFLGEFLTIDTLGMSVPRGVQGFNRNKKELGHLNYKAGKEEFGRELISGPAFFVIPAGILLTMSLIKGKATKVGVETLDAFKLVMQKATQKLSNLKTPKTIKDNFINSFLSEAFIGFKHETSQIDKIKNIFSKIVDRDKSMPPKKAKKEAAEALTILNKANGEFIDDTSSIKIGNKKLNISELVDDIPNYLEDFNKKAAKSSENNDNFINKFHEKVALVRKSTNIFAVATLSAFLLMLPKFYQTDKKFPGLDGLDTEGKLKSSDSPQTEGGSK